MADVSDVKAGKYQLVALRWDKILSKPGEPFDFKRYHRGDEITLDVEDARRLVAAGAVVKPGELERQRAEEAKRAYEAAMALVPDSLREEDTGATGETGGAEVPADFDPERPDKYNVDVVQAYLASASEEQRRQVVDAEASGKKRKGVVEWEPPGSDGS